MLRVPRAIAVVIVAVALTTPTSVAAARPSSGPPTTDDVAHDAGLQWGLDRIGATEAWSRSTGSGIVIAVVDSGVALDHEDLASKLVAGVACRGTNGDADQCTGSAQDDDGHGSHVAGIAAASTGNGVGIAGVAPDAAIMPVKVLFKDCPTCQASGTAADVAAGIRWAVDHGADIVNLSLGSTTSSVFGPAFADAVRDAWARGAIPVVAAGNQFVLTADFGDAPAVVVSATDRDDRSPSYSNGVGNAQWAVAAPGGEAGDTASSCSQSGAPLGILSTYWAPADTAAYACLSGTSMAAPHVSGALAILLGAGLDPRAAVTTLLDTAVDLGAPGRDQVFGAGRIDLATATARVPAAPATPTTDSTAVPLSTPTSAAGTTPTISDPEPTDGTGTTSVPPTTADTEGTSTAQPFVHGEESAPTGPGILAAVLIVAVGATALSLRRRGLA